MLSYGIKKKLPKQSHTKVTPARVWGSQNIQGLKHPVIDPYWKVLETLFLQCGIEEATSYREIYFYYYTLKVAKWASMGFQMASW